MEPSGPLPSPRSNPILAFDDAQRVRYLHGGRSGGTALDDLWAFDLVTSTWTTLDPPGERPAVRFSHSGIFDSRRAALVIFAGQAQGFAFHSDVWAFDTQAGRWTRIVAPQAGPTSRYGFGFGYDPEGDRFLISHGFTAAGRFDDTWAWAPLHGRTSRQPLGVRGAAACTPAHMTRRRAACSSSAARTTTARTLAIPGCWRRVIGSAWIGPGPAAWRFPASVADAGVAWLPGRPDCRRCCG